MSGAAPLPERGAIRPAKRGARLLHDPVSDPVPAGFFVPVESA